MVSQIKGKFKSVHCIGVGGIGLSAAAVFMLRSGAQVSGSDIENSPLLEQLAAVGVKVMLGHASEHLAHDVDLVLYSPAVAQDNPELVVARKRGVYVMSYPEFLGALSREYRTIAVSGTHGKSTVTAMIGLILEQAGYDPTVIVGSKVPSFEFGNLRMGASQWLVLEACEHQGNMRHIACEVAVVTAIEKDHLDYYRDVEHIRATFQEFVNGVASSGTVIVNGDDAECGKLRAAHAAKVTYGLNTQCDWRIREREYGNGVQHARVVHGAQELGTLTLRIPGAFNMTNALAACAATGAVGCEFTHARTALEAYRGIWRRFELVGATPRGVPVISDYGHHPTAVAKTLTAARELYPDKRIVLVFQPHQHNRTKQLFGEFVDALAGADALVCVEVYDVPGREEIADQNVSSRDIVNALKKRGMREVWYASDLAQAQELAEHEAKQDSIVLVMGAGDVWHVAHKLVS